MKIESAAGWGRTGELTLLSLIFLAPLAAHGRTFDPAALRTALVESAALTLALAWAMKGLARGRWDAPEAVGSVLGPLAGLAAWTLARFAAEPFHLAALPGLAASLSAWLIYAAALLELGGARHAARLAFWATAATALVGGAAAAQRMGIFGLALDGSQLAAFAAVALPAALSLRLDPESSPSRRAFAAAAAAALAVLAAWSGTARGVVGFELSAVAFAAAAKLLLDGPQARRASLIALVSAAGALGLALLLKDGGSAPSAASGMAAWRESPLVGIGPGALILRPGASSGTLLTDALAETGGIGALLLIWTWGVAVLAGLNASWNLRRRGAVAEAGYAAAFAAGFGAWGVSAALGFAPATGPGAWLAWAGAGAAAGLGPLATPRGVVKTLPLPCGEEVRRLMQGSALTLFAALFILPGLWLASDVRYNRALAALRSGGFEAALADADGVWPGSGLYAPALELRGRALAALGRPQEALDAYARLDGLVPDFARLHARRAEAYAALGEWPDSVRERSREDALSPASARDLVAWAQAARAAGDLDAAQAAANRAAALTPEDPAVRGEIAANALMRRRIAARVGRTNERQALKGKPTPR